MFYGKVCRNAPEYLRSVDAFFWDWKRNRIMKQFLWASFLVAAVGLSATGLYFNETWKLITRSWLEGWARNML